MLKRPSEHRLTLEERVAVVVAIVAAVGVHVAVFLVGGGIGRLAHQEKRRERLMVIRRVREITPAPELAVRVPDPRRVQMPAEPAPEGKAGGAPPKPEQKTSPRGALPPPPKAEITPTMEEELQSSQPKDETGKAAEQKSAEVGDNSVSVVTDLPAASFTVTGPAEYRGTGTFWIRRGAPAGTYRVAFSAVDGFSTPPPQTKELPEKGQIVFVGKYRRSTEVVVDSNETGALFTIYRPDGRPIDLNRPGQAFFDDLPPGNYTAVFKDVAGRVTPTPITQALSAGGRLAFYGEYKGRGVIGGSGSGPGSGSGTGSGTGVGAGAGTGSGLRGSGSGGGGTGLGRGRESGRGVADAEMDRRVQLVVKSYPVTDIEEDHPPIAYPELVIRKSNFQAGWCQVYLIIKVDRSGEVEEIGVERPRPGDRAQYEALIKMVEASVRGWDYDKVSAEVHVDARFYVE